MINLILKNRKEIFTIKYYKSPGCAVALVI